MTLPSTGLPVEAGIADILTALRTTGRVVVVAPPGAGKTTVVPIRLAEMLHGDGDSSGRIVMLEPRRLAARAAAQRMASLLGEPVGERVGYQTRDERRIGPRTRIEVVTEGILTRRLLGDPTLPGVAAVIFDEVHERNLPTDLGLALALDAASVVREDLMIAAMSATVDADAFAAVLAGSEGSAPVVRVDGRTFPVEIHHHGLRREQRLLEATADMVLTAMNGDPGDVLVFLPGIGEIRRMHTMLDARVGPHIDVFELAGSLSLAEQDAALAASAPGRRRIVLSTDIAETSLTVEGIRIVVDAGQARVPRFDARTGMTRLTTITASRASADQRAGRAGRVEPGVAHRMWSRGEHQTRRRELEPEILQVDLAGVALDLALWGARDDAAVGQMSFVDPPSRRGLDQARMLLTRLGALDAHGFPTEIGRAMARLGVHPRLAAMIVNAPSESQRSLACEIAALVDERDVVRGRPDDLASDLGWRLEIARGDLSDERMDRGAVATWRRRVEDLQRRSDVSTTLVTGITTDLGTALAHGYPDRIALRRRRGQFQFLDGSGAWLPDDDPLADVAVLVVADTDGDRRRARIRRAAAVDPDAIPDLLADATTTVTSWSWEGDDLMEVIERRIGSVVVTSTRRRPEPTPEVSAQVLARVRDIGLPALGWTPEASSLRARVRFVNRILGAPWPSWSDQELLDELEDWLIPILGHPTGLGEVAALDVTLPLRARLPWPEAVELDELAPSTWTLPAGREVPIDYAEALENSPGPVVAARAQQWFGTTEHPRILQGRVPLTVIVLSPADRPLQITSDLPGFWTGSWAQVRAEMAGRYPKHAWPVDPGVAPPTR